MNKGTLYLIPCPISEDTLPYDVTPEGNREVITSLDYFIVENLRSARRFLSKAGLSGKIDELEFDELSEHTTSPRDVERMVAKIKAGRSAGVISEAGVPAVDVGKDYLYVICTLPELCAMADRRERGLMFYSICSASKEQYVADRKNMVK